MTRLFVAEKPSVAKAIAAELGVTGRGEGFISCGDSVVTWCFGHMLELAEPDAYTPEDVPRTRSGRKVWRDEELPILPGEWILVPKADAKKQLRVIGRLLKQATVIVNAGDPDREGQLLVDEVLEHFRNRKPVRRFWVSAQDAVSVQRGLAKLQDNHAFFGMAEAARARQRADWLIGMNLSRAYTLRAKRGGSQALLAVGRVQTPTLSLVVERDRVIEAFVPKPYYLIQAQLEHADGRFWASWKAKADQVGLDPEGRLVDRAIADGIVAAVRGQAGRVTAYKQEAKTQAQPLAFALSDLTLLASQRYGYSAEQVLRTAQALYETHKLTSYPRTDCAHLPEVQHADAPRVLAALRKVNPDLQGVIDQADPSIRTRTWNDAKVTAHHGIIPTMHEGDRSALSEPERRIYELVVRQYLAQFYPEHRFLSTRVEVAVQGEDFGATGKVVTDNGWREVVEPRGKQAEPPPQALPQMTKGDPVTCTGAERRDALTKPPPRFSEGTLIRAMEEVYKWAKEPEDKKLLREGDGIGTSATRATILSELRRRQFLEAQGKHIVSTPLGRALVDALPGAVKDPALTALYERTLKAIEAGKAELAAFLSEQESVVRKRVAEAGKGALSIQLPGEPGRAKEAGGDGAGHKCRGCGRPLRRRPSRAGKGHWWGCTGYPTCKQTYADSRGRPAYGPAARGAAGVKAAGRRAR